jgi:hypothetical protein
LPFAAFRFAGREHAADALRRGAGIDGLIRTSKWRRVGEDAPPSDCSGSEQATQSSGQDA